MSTSDSLPAVPREVAPPSDAAPSATDSSSVDPAALKQPAGAAETAPAQPAQQLLPLHSAVVPQQPLPRTGGRPRQLWLGIHLPLLPLEALRRQRASAAGAVFEECEGVRRILLTDRAAGRQGVASGMSVNAALALVPALDLLPRDPGRETRVLEALAARAGRFTSLVSIESSDGLLLEIAGSLTLFGGSEALLRQVAAELAGAGFTAALAVAPTPLASTWLARNGKAIAGTTSVVSRVTHAEYLAGALGPLPLDCLRWPDAVCDSLAGMGVTRLGDCLRLPREGFARRFGALRLLQLDRALGRLPDPRAGYRAPERFCRECELDEEEEDCESLLAVCRGLLDELERFLVARQVAAQHLRFVFFHLKARATPLEVGGLEPGYSAGHWHDLLAMKLDRLVLPAPVIAIRLEGGHLQACRADTGGLPFRREPESPRAMPAARLSATRLIERLAARIGDHRVHGVTVAAEHRPHRAGCAVRPPYERGTRLAQCDLPQDGWHARRAPRLLGVFEADGLLLERPLWMLAEPLPLDVEQAVPQYQGPLRIENGPERLETGWWDGEGIARDYFVAVNPGGMHLWIYRNRCNRRRDRDHGSWYLHGIFA